AGEYAAILDGNVKRVLARHFEIEGFPGRASVDRELWRIAERELPPTEIASYTQGLMDLGATICTRARPACEKCPVAATCLARRRGRVTELPTPRPKRVRPTRSATLIVVRDERGAFLLQRRPPTGIWGGLASPLECDPGLDSSSLADEVHRRLGFGVELGEPLGTVRHEFSHYTFVMHPRLARPVTATRASDAAGLVWVDEKSIEHAALPAPIRRLLLDVVRTTALVEQG
ncbi:MAG: NUDIX domain-containing protein, partial [Burkholderiaceae bacterium]